MTRHDASAGPAASGNFPGMTAFPDTETLHG